MHKTLFYGILGIILWIMPWPTRSSQSPHLPTQVQKREQKADVFLKQLDLAFKEEGMDRKRIQSILKSEAFWKRMGPTLKWRTLLEARYLGFDQAISWLGPNGLNDKAWIVLQYLDQGPEHGLLEDFLHRRELGAALDKTSEHLLKPLWASDEERAALEHWLEQQRSSGKALVDAFFKNNPVPSLRSRFEQKVQEAQTEAMLWASIEIWLWDALLTFAHQMNVGNPSNISDQIRRQKGEERIIDQRIIALFEPILKDDAHALDKRMASWMPSWPEYQRLKMALARYRRMARQGDWPKISKKGHFPLKLGDRDERIPILRARLSQEGYGSWGDLESERFDKDLQKALKRYEKGHQLEVNGQLDRDDLKSLNTSLYKRIAQIEVSLAHWRRSPLLGDDFYLVINLPTFMGEYWRYGEKVHAFKVIVGSNGYYWAKGLKRRLFVRATPLISAEVKKINFNPYWIVPEQIRIKELEPHLEEDPEWYEKNGYERFDNGGRIQVRQLPGPQNALGKVKFLMPNPHHIYLHDTPDRFLFRAELRAFSHGCIRVHEPLKLAKMLMIFDGYSKAERVVSTYEKSFDQGSYLLRTPIPVHMDYRVVSVDEDGTVIFGADLYRLDLRRVLRRMALDGFNLVQ